MLSGELLRDLGRQLWNSSEWQIRVEDEDGEKVCAPHLFGCPFITSPEWITAHPPGLVAEHWCAWLLPRFIVSVDDDDVAAIPEQLKPV